jgi:hypothetical protein
LTGHGAHDVTELVPSLVYTLTAALACPVGHGLQLFGVCWTLQKLPLEHPSECEHVFGAGVGFGVGDGVGLTVGLGVGDGDGTGDGAGVGLAVGLGVGDGDGAGDGAAVGLEVGAGVGLAVGVGVGAPVTHVQACGSTELSR